MNARAILLTMLLGLFAASACFAADANMGTWKLNEAKSTPAPGAAKNSTVVYAAAGEMVKVTVDGTSADGKPLHHEWTGKFDGKDYPVSGDPSQDSRSYTKVDDRTLDMTVKKGGKTVSTGKIVVSSDGKSRTVTVSTTGKDGKPATGTAVYDKQ